MDWKEELTNLVKKGLWGNVWEPEEALKDLIPFTQQLLNQRDEEIIRKLEKIRHTGSCYEEKCESTFNQGVNEAISTIKEL